MPPLNQNERKKAFVNFTVFFLAVVLLILVTAFFSFRVPFEDNERLREINKVTQAENEFRDTFNLTLTDVVAGLDAINKDEFAAQAESKDIEIQGKISKMGILTAQNSVSNKEFYSRIADLLSACRAAKKEVRDMKASKGAEKDWEEKYRLLEENYRRYREDVEKQRLRP